VEAVKLTMIVLELLEPTVWLMDLAGIVPLPYAPSTPTVVSQPAETLEVALPLVASVLITRTRLSVTLEQDSVRTHVSATTGAVVDLAL